MSQRPESFPADYRAILGAGEAGGSIGLALNQIAELLSRRLEMRGKIAAALLYPIVLILTSLLSVAVIVFVLVPSLSPIFTDAGLPLPGILSTFAGLRDNWVSTTFAFGLAGSISILMWRAIRYNREMRLAFHRLLCRTPVVGTLVRLREAAAFTRGLGTLLSTHASLISALQTAQTLIGNRYLARLYCAACERVPQGTPLHRALDGNGLIPSNALRLVAVGEESGQLGAKMVQAASMLENDLQRQIERMVGLMTPVLTLTIGAGIGALIMQVMSAVLSINNLAFQ
jgi:general secretion pathway protein F